MYERSKSVQDRTVITYEDTHEVHTLVVGQAVTGLNAFQ